MEIILVYYYILGGAGSSEVNRCETDLGRARVCEDGDKGEKVTKSSDHMTIVSQCKFMYMKKAIN